MSTITIANLPTASGIDGAADYLAIETASPHATNKINRNTLLGVTSQPLGLTDSQSPTNKTFNNTNIFTVLDTNLTLQDDSDNTKQAKFQLSGITTGTTRTYTLPNVSDTLVSLTATQTLTNKTLTSPTITGGTIDNSTITVDSIAGHSTSTIVTVANMQISNGVINSANAVTATSIASGAVQPQALQSGTGSGWAWQTYSPTLTNLTAGNGLVEASYIQTGKTVDVFFRFTMGSTSSMGSTPTISLPVTAAAIYNSGSGNKGTPVGNLFIEDSGVAFFVGIVIISSSTTTFLPEVVTTGTTYSGVAAFTASVPHSWKTNDRFQCQLTYQAA